MKKLLPLALIASLCSMESRAEIKKDAKIFASVNMGAGFMPGIGAGTEVEVHNNRIGLRVDGQIFYQVKKSADSGYSYDGNAAARFFPKNQVFLEGGLHAGGYRSHIPETPFSQEAVWKSHRRMPMIGAGYKKGDSEYTLRAFGTRQYEPYDTVYVEFSCTGRPDNEHLFGVSLAGGANRDKRNNKTGAVFYGTLKWYPFKKKRQ